MRIKGRLDCSTVRRLSWLLKVGRGSVGAYDGYRRSEQRSKSSTSHEKVHFVVSLSSSDSLPTLLATHSRTRSEARPIENESMLHCTLTSTEKKRQHENANKRGKNPSRPYNTPPLHNPNINPSANSPITVSHNPAPPPASPPNAASLLAAVISQFSNLSIPS